MARKVRIWVSEDFYRFALDKKLEDPNPKKPLYKVLDDMTGASNKRRRNAIPPF